MAKKKDEMFEKFDIEFLRYKFEARVFYSGVATTCFIYAGKGTQQAVGAVVLSPKDVYSKEEGRRLAYNDAMRDLCEGIVNEYADMLKDKDADAIERDLYSQARMAYRKVFGLPLSI